MRKILVLLTFLFTASQLWGQAPLANFTAAQTSGCSPLVISFQDQSTGNPTTWRWDFGNGNTSTLQNPSATYFTGGTYTVTLTVTNSSGTNTLTRQGYITIYEKPSVNFSADKTAGCFPIDIKFNDASVASAGTTNVSWQWDFGNGEQSAEQSPQIRYTSAGNYTISLRVANDKGCFASISRNSYIKLAGSASAAFSNTTVNRCQPPYPVQFTNASSAPGTVRYIWDFGDGNTSAEKDPSHVYAAPGTYSVSLAVTSSEGCTDTIRKPNLITIQPVTTAFTAPDVVCANRPAAFTNTSSPAPQSTVWRFGDGSTATTPNAVKSFASPGQYTVQMINNYGFCSDSFAKQLTVLPRPRSVFSANGRSQCKPPLTVSFQDASVNAVSWRWLFGDGQTSTQQNPTHTYTDFGNFAVTLITTNAEGCTDTLQQANYIQIRKPAISFPDLPKTGCIPYTTTFSPGISTLDNVTSYLWNFGDGNTSTEARPTHTYPNQGNYQVSLTITTSTGCTESFTLADAVIVGRKPVIDFTATPNPVCAFAPIQFSNTASEGDIWYWSFSDGTTSFLQSPVHAYKDTGRFTVMLEVINSGCSQILTKPGYITVKPPISKFRFEKDCNSPRLFSFRDESIGASNWFWDFGDGTTSTEQNPVHLYSATGTYAISLTVGSDTCSHSSATTVIVFDDPLSFTANIREACKAATIQFTSKVENPENVASYEWNFFNGQSSGEVNPSVTYTAAGDFPVSLVTRDIYGCTDTTYQHNYIRVNGPVANFSAINNNGCRGLTATFNDLSNTDGRHPVVQWQWDYGDGRTGNFTNATTFQHTYSDIGSFPVRLTITDAAGCRDSLRLPDLVSTSAPKALFSSADTLTCLGSNVQFDNRSTAQNFTSEWQFGNGVVSNAASPAYRYTDTGQYTVQLKITDGNGCTDSLILPRYITIHKTTASFTVSDSVGACTPYEVRFTNKSDFYTSSFWNFTNGTSRTMHPVHTFLESGTYPVTLVVTGRGGCTDTASKTIRVFDDSATKITYSPVDGCGPLRITASASTPAQKNYSWDFGDGTLVTTTNNTTVHTYTSFGSFLPRLIITDSGNCLLPFTGPDTVRVKGVAARFAVDNRLLCDSGLVRFSDSTVFNDRSLQYRWDFGDGNTSSLASPEHRYLQPGLYTVTLTAETESLCRDTATLVNLVKVVQSPLVAIAGDTLLCQNEMLAHTGTFLRQDTSAVAWFWQFPNGATSTGRQPPAQRYTNVGDFFVRAIAVNSSGCTDTAIRSLRIHPLPAISVPPSFTTIVGTPVSIQPATYTANVVNWEWTPAATLSCTNCPQPVANPKFNTTYTVVATDSNGCRNTAQVQVIVFCANANVFVPNTFSPNGDGNNDVFYVRGSGLARVKSLRIFNRLGEVIFQRQNFAANDAAAGWDGTFRGAGLAPDTYIYQLDVFCDNSDTIRFDGSITLIR